MKTAARQIRTAGGGIRGGAAVLRQEMATLTAALGIPGGVVDNVQQFGGQVRIARPETVEVTALRPLEPPRYARPTP